jgi:hypothetical protein
MSDDPKKPSMTEVFKAPSSHVWIGSLDEGDAPGPTPPGGALVVKAQYNPAALEVAQNVPWKKPDAATQGGAQNKGLGKDENYMTLEFTGAEGRTISLELLFDDVEGGKRSGGVAESVKRLETLAAVRDPTSSDEKLRRPHHCLVVWGSVLPNFQCVIEGLTTKYSMFSSDGVPLRATCTVKLKEALKTEKAPPPKGKK